MKKIFIFIIAFGMAVTGLMACTAKNPTGYPSGTVQREYIFCQGTRYVFSGDCLEKADGLKEIGAVQKVDNESLPDEEWEASRLTVGQKVYVNSLTDSQMKQIYVEWPDKGYFQVFKPDVP